MTKRFIIATTNLEKKTKNKISKSIESIKPKPNNKTIKQNKTTKNEKILKNNDKNSKKTQK